MKIHVKRYQFTGTLTLEKMLRRRKMTLQTFLQEQGISTYEGLRIRCDGLGCVPPTEQEYVNTMQPVVSNPSEGVVILEPIPVVSDKTGHEVEEIAPAPTMADLAGMKVEDEKPSKRKRGGFQRTSEETTTDLSASPDKLAALDGFLTGTV